MAYTPTNWECGDVVTAEALNKIENGIANAGGGGGIVISYDHTETNSTIKHVYDKTYQEVWDAMLAGKAVYMRPNDPDGSSTMILGVAVVGSDPGDQNCHVEAALVMSSGVAVEMQTLVADTPSDYLYRNMPLS